ncbi:hypothetical protein PV341_12135 [Streptomyces sp. PA03-1a]|nr:hypothetical protein [Streptomyces sp. PA03-1a]
MDGELAVGGGIKLTRLRYGRSATTWDLALYLASTDKYEDTLLPTGTFAGTPEDALDCACGLQLATPDIWLDTRHPTNLGVNPRRTSGADH